MSAKVPDENKLMEVNKLPDGSKMTNGNKVTVWTAIGAVAALATIHSIFIVPSILGRAGQDAHAIAREEVRLHASQPHIGAVTQREMSLLMSRINHIVKQIDLINEKIK